MGDEKLHKIEDVESLSIFHPNLTLMRVCESMRKYEKQSGAYLLRPSFSSPGIYSISVMHNKELLHFKVNRKDGNFFIGDKSFDNIQSLVWAFKNFPIINDQGFLDVYLKHPICRYHGPSSWEGFTLKCCLQKVPFTTCLSMPSLSSPSSQEPTTHRIRKPSTSDSDWEEIQKEVPYVNGKSGPRDNFTNDSNDQNNFRIELTNGWIVEPLLAFKSRNGEIKENPPPDFWLSLSNVEQQKVKSLSERFSCIKLGKKTMGVTPKLLKAISVTPFSKPVTPEVEWENIPNLNELPYANPNSGEHSRRVFDPSELQNDFRSRLRNGWIVEPLLVFRSPNGEIHEAPPPEFWLSQSDEERISVSFLAGRFPYLQSNKKKLGSSRRYFE